MVINGSHAHLAFGPDDVDGGRFYALLVKQRQGTSQDVPLGLGTAPWVAALEEIDRFPSSVHAIALCNAAELAGGMMTEVSIPSGARWIPKGMTVEYLAKEIGRAHV